MCAANVSRRALLGGIASAPLASAVPIAPKVSAWERALKTYAAARSRAETFLTTVLRPAYRRHDADLINFGIPDDAQVVPPGFRNHVTAAERKIVEAGGGRAEIIRLRSDNPAHAQLRSALASDLRQRRARGKAMRRHKVFELEEQGNDLRAIELDALRDLVAIPAPDRAGLLTKVRLAYEEIYRHEDDDELLRAIFADVERLSG
jgi:hypothetical protein